ncbi:S8 family serine peptidase [cf. Phormidesmis sp. LEGE 11477]|nr:S8 family serine peptidase [cf. Phormidesmis sp. LEGE 11477]
MAQSANGGMGVLPGQEGVILQRGGEELQLRKLKDRLSFCWSFERVDGTVDASEISELSARWRPEQVKNITPSAERASPDRDGQNGQIEWLLEWQLDPADLEAALAELRSLDAIVYASHVYELVVSPRAYAYLSNQLTVQFVDDLPIDQIEEIARAVGIVRLQPIVGDGNTHSFKVGPAARQNPLKIANHLKRQPQVLLAEPNIIMAIAPLYRPTDDRYPQQWYLHHRGGRDLASGSHVFAEKAWDITRGSRSITIAIADDAFDLSHPDLQGAGKLVAPRDFKNSDGLPTPATDKSENHGTAVAGVALAEETGAGIVGIAPGCSLMPIQTTGYLDDVSIERLFSWAIEQGADVISCSWSPASTYFGLSRRISQVIRKAATQGRDGKGCVVLFSAGNANRPVKGQIEEAGWPKNVLRGLTKWLCGFAVHPDVITVSACTSLNRKAAYSNWGRDISVAAPSNNAPPSMSLSTGQFDTGPPIKTALPGRVVLTSDRTGDLGYTTSDYTGFGGTSSACPLVAGVVGLMLSVNPDLTAREVKQILQRTTDKIIDKQPDPQLNRKHGTYSSSGHSLWFGYGKVNAFKAVQAAQAKGLSGSASKRTLSKTLTAENIIEFSIPDDDPRGIVSPVVVNESGALQDIKVYIQAEHEFLSDLTFTLISPQGQTVLVQGRTLGRQTRLQRTYSLVSTPALRQLLNSSVAGRWQLQIVDHVPGSVGQLKKWELVLGI